MPARAFRGPLAAAAALALCLAAAPAAAAGLPGYATSKACRDCHPSVWREWSMTPHARMLRSVEEHPDAVAADKFSPDIPFRKRDIHYTIGSHWIQKYLTVIDGQFYVLPKYWSMSKGDWEPYSIFNWRSKPYSLNCYGCHTVGFDPVSKTLVEDSIGCEACHGPGAKHVASQDPKDIVNPARLPKRLADNICESCHTDGNDMLDGVFPFAAGFQPGEPIEKYYSDFFLPKPGSKKWYKGNATYEDRHRMFMFYQAEFYAKNRSCGV